jgi:ankyrin repeat protein
LLLEKGADPNVRYDAVPTPLHLAARKGELEIVKLLVAAGADVAATTPGGAEAATAAEKLGHHEVAEFLRNHQSR